MRLFPASEPWPISSKPNGGTTIASDQLQRPSTADLLPVYVFELDNFTTRWFNEGCAGTTLFFLTTARVFWYSAMEWECVRRCATSPNCAKDKCSGLQQQLYHSRPGDFSLQHIQLLVTSLSSKISVIHIHDPGRGTARHTHVSGGRSARLSGHSWHGPLGSCTLGIDGSDWRPVRTAAHPHTERSGGKRRLHRLFGPASTHWRRVLWRHQRHA